jgi:hypothetical protein
MPEHMDDDICLIKLLNLTKLHGAFDPPLHNEPKACLHRAAKVFHVRLIVGLLIACVLSLLHIHGYIGYPLLHLLQAWTLPPLFNTNTHGGAHIDHEQIGKVKAVDSQDFYKRNHGMEHSSINPCSATPWPNRAVSNALLGTNYPKVYHLSSYHSSFLFSETAKTISFLLFITLHICYLGTWDPKNYHQVFFSKRKFQFSPSHGRFFWIFLKTLECIPTAVWKLQLQGKEGIQLKHQTLNSDRGYLSMHPPLWHHCILQQLAPHVSSNYALKTFYYHGDGNGLIVVIKQKQFIACFLLSLKSKERRDEIDKAQQKCIATTVAWKLNSKRGSVRRQRLIIPCQFYLAILAFAFVSADQVSKPIFPISKPSAPLLHQPVHISKPPGPVSKPTVPSPTNAAPAPIFMPLGLVPKPTFPIPKNTAPVPLSKPIGLVPKPAVPIYNPVWLVPKPSIPIPSNWAVSKTTSSHESSCTVSSKTNSSHP